VPTPTKLADYVDDKFLEKILANAYHVLCNILAKGTVSSDGLRLRHHIGELVDETSHLVQCCFIVCVSHIKMSTNFNR